MKSLLPRSVLPIKHACRHWKIYAITALIAAISLPLLCDRLIASTADDQCHRDLADLEARPVALLLGTAREINGKRNAFYSRRIEAAAELFQSGKVRGILASGDNGRCGYDEPSDMKADLIAAGVPADLITLDFAGFRTRDSIVRAKKVFGQDDLIIVSQRFHAERALFIARQEGIDASAYIAADPASKGSNQRVRARELLARTVAIADSLIDRQPRFLGEPEVVALRSQ